MKKFIGILLVSSLLFSVAETNVLMNEVYAKENKTKSTVIEKKIFFNLKGGESKSKVKKIAKKNALVQDLNQSSKRALVYKDVNVYGYTSWLIFNFNDETKKLESIRYSVSFLENFNKKIKNDELKKYHNLMYKKIKKDVGNKKGETVEVTLEGDYFYSQWIVNGTRLYFMTDTLEYSIQRILYKEEFLK